MLTWLSRLGLVVGVCAGAVGVWADVLIDTVPVGNAGNEADTRYATPGYGRVDYTYNIGKYEVTAGQYTAFLNAVAGVDTYGLYNVNMWLSNYCKIERYAGNGTPGTPYQYRVANDAVGGYWAGRPVTYVSYWDACRFANWLHNGQPTGAQGPGTTETGAYTLNGHNGTDGDAILRNPGWQWAVTSEDEWYKAAYHKNDGPTGNYFDYATGSNDIPGRDLNDASGGNANYYGDPYPIQSPYYTTLAGEFQDSDSPYGTFDQDGNVWEWNEALSTSLVTLRGGSFSSTADRMHASFWHVYYSTNEYYDLGFRVSAVPEPASIVLLAVCVLGISRRR